MRKGSTRTRTVLVEVLYEEDGYDYLACGHVKESPRTTVDRIRRLGLRAQGKTPRVWCWRCRAEIDRIRAPQWDSQSWIREHMEVENEDRN